MVDKTLEDKVRENSEGSLSTQRKVNTLMDCIVWYVTYKITVATFKIILDL